MNVRNEPRRHLQIKGVIDGDAGVVGGKIAFRPNIFIEHPAEATTGILDGRGIRISPLREGDGNLWVTAFEYFG